MNKQEAIEKIELLFPPDKHEFGRILLKRALFEEWRNFPDNILIRLARLCMEIDNAV